MKSYAFFIPAVVVLIGGACIKSNVQGTVPPILASADLGNNRILLFRPPLLVNGASAYLVLGQPDFTSNAANNGGPSLGMNTPRAVCIDGNHVIVADSLNNRVLIWNSYPTTNQQSPNVVLGQPDFNTVSANTSGLSAQSMSDPRGVGCGDGKLIVSDTGNLRVLIWNSFPTSLDQPADLVLGALNMTSAGVSAPTASSTWVPRDVSYSGTHIYLADDGSKRISVWNSWPTTNNQPADLVLGQPDFVSSATNNTPGAAGTTSAQSFNPQLSVCTNGSQLVVGDNNNSRALIWNKLPTAMQQPADLVLGQPDFSHSSVGNTPGAPLTISAQSMGGGGLLGVACGKSSVIVSDKGYERILIWNSWPTYNQQPADIVVGEPTMTANPWSYQTNATSFYTNWGVGGNFLVQGLYKVGGY